MKQAYQITLTPTEAGYVVYVPDLDINTQGVDIPDAIAMARDAIGLWGICQEDAGETIPKPSMQPLKCESNEIITLVDIDFDIYRRENDNRAIKKTLTLPNWLNAQAEKAGINFSQTLQAALRKQLNISTPSRNARSSMRTTRKQP